MIIRQLQYQDLIQLEQIHREQYAHEFTFEDFLNKFLDGAVAISESGEIISAVGVRPLIEAVMLTNKKFSRKERSETIQAFRPHLERITHNATFKQLHAFVQDKSWENHLLKLGFKQCVGNALIINF